jgi:putative ABC transport system permease protein
MGVSACYFEIFGLRPAVGRFFNPEDEVLGHEPVLVLSHGFWQQRFGGDPDVVGMALDLDNTRYVIIGVAPEQFVDPFGGEPLIFRSRPPGWDATRLARFNHSWRAVGKLADGVSLERAQSDLDRIWSNLANEYPDSHTGEGVHILTAKEWMVGNVRAVILVLLGAASLVLLIACGNVANLLITRTVLRGREVALRAALGASQGRIVRQLVTEVGLLFVTGGVVGLGLAWAGKDLLLTMGGQNLPRLTETRVDLTVLGFTLAVSLVTGLIFGLTAAYPIVRRDLAAALQAGGRSASGDRRSQRVRGSLVVAEVALALVLLTGGGLLLRSLWYLQQVEPGFQTENVLTMRVFPRAGAYTEPEEITALYQDLTARLASTPGVTAAGAANFIPMWFGQNCEFVWPDDRPIPTREALAISEAPRCLEVRVVAADYFRALGIPVVRGRAFTDEDDEASSPVALINQTAADLMFRGEEPLDNRLTLYETRDFLPNISRAVVGVVGDVRQVGLAADPSPAIYMPHTQEPDQGRRRVMTLILRTDRSPTEVADLARATVWEVDDKISIDYVQTMATLVDLTTAQPRFRTTLVLAFGGIALLLAMVGVAGVVGYAVSQRIPEIGLRMALGAQTRDIYAMVMGQGVKLTALGVILGLAGSLAATRVLAGLLFGVSAVDPISLAGAAALLALIALLAVWIPARKALRVDPLVVLDAE